MSPIETRKLHILVVDDEATIARLADRILRQEGHEVVTAENVVEARAHMDAMLKNGGLDAILSDWDMAPDGKGAGAKVLSAGREAGVHALVGMSGRLDYDDKTGGVFECSVKNEMRMAGAKEFLPKPFLPSQIIAAVRSALESQIKNK